MLCLHLHTELCSSLQIQLLVITSVIIWLCMQVLALFAGQLHDIALQDLQDYVMHHNWTKQCTCMQVLALFAGQPYDRHLQELQNLDAHLTNTCRHARTDVEKEDAVHLLSELPQVNSQTPGVHLSYLPPHVYVYVNVCTCIYIYVYT